MARFSAVRCSEGWMIKDGSEDTVALTKESEAMAVCRLLNEFNQSVIELGNVVRGCGVSVDELSDKLDESVWFDGAAFGSLDDRREGDSYD